MKEEYIINRVLDKIKDAPKELSGDDFYSLAHDTFMDVVSEIENENPTISLDYDSDVTWYDEYLDNGIMEQIMLEMVNKGFSLKDF